MEKIKSWGVFLIIGMVIASCQKEQLSPASGSGNQNASSPEMKSVKMTATPGNPDQNYAMVNLELKNVEVFVEGNGWASLNTTVQSFNALSLENGSELEIANSGNASIKADLVSKVRLTFGQSNQIVLASPIAEVDFSLTGSTDQSITIDIQRQDKAQAEIVIALNLEHALTQSSSGWSFTPVVEFIEQAQTGIKGSATGAAEAIITVRNENHLYKTFLSAHGEFMVRNMEEGTYDIIVEPISEGLSTLSDMKISGVQVVEGRITSTQQIHFQ